MDGSDKRPNRLKSRQSLAHIPSSSRSNNIDKQNVTIDFSTAGIAPGSNTQLSKKRTRGKSLGPGGLEALNETDGNTIKNPPSLQPRSILKPTVPLTPPRIIPTFDELRQKTSRKKSPAQVSTEALLIDFSTPGPTRGDSSSNINTISHNQLDPFSPLKATSTNIDENKNENERLRQEQKKAALEQRAARRKSMANRRVSFAPEATLHTWSVMEMVEDSTTSSTSNSTRRQSTMTTQQTSQDIILSTRSESDPAPIFQTNENEEALVNASPVHQKDTLQKERRRRSSAMSEDMNISGDEQYSSSPSGDVATDSSPIRVEDSIGSDSESDGDTAMSIEEVTQNSVHSVASGSSTRSSLEERLREAASHAGTKGIEYDEHGDDVSMEIANDTVTNAFQPWTRGQHQRISPTVDQENVNPFSPTRAQEFEVEEEEVEDDMTQGVTMDMTRAVGGILGNDHSVQKPRRKSVTNRRRSSMNRRQSVAADSAFGDESMDLTTVNGGILTDGVQNDDIETGISDEELTMEFTTAIGGVQGRNKRESLQSVTSDGNETMEMTTAFGGILAPIEEQTEPQTDYEDDNTIAMEMTRAVGQIWSKESKQDRTTQSAANDANTMDSAIEENLIAPEGSLPANERKAESTPKQLAPVASETGSPSLITRSRSSGRTRTARISLGLTSRSPTASTPRKSLLTSNKTTPTKQLTPVPTRAKTPERTPMSGRVSHHGVSPKKLFQAEITARMSPASAKKPDRKQQDPLFAKDELTGRQTPRVVLHAPKPHQHLRRRSSGIGIDKEGFGSPNVTEILSRRSSIGDAAPQFKLEHTKAPRLRFEDPRQIQEELDAERAAEERRESGRFVMEQEANEQQDENATLQLKDMIESMTPKRSKNSKSKSRKSLAVGSARGLLGKRPAELDGEDDSDDNTPKRLKAVSREGSPVKKVHLPKPPSKEQTTGRLTKTEQDAVVTMMTGNLTPLSGLSPSRPNAAGSPQQSKRYRDVPKDASADRPTSFEDKLDNVVGATDPSVTHPSQDTPKNEEDKISLQDFLNMTNIHFIELNTTKRRHTLAQNPTAQMSVNGVEQSISTKASFVAAATTMPLLELYQHATKELKSYISSGRKIIRSIENETLADQPPLFREYVEARPDVKLVMDNQFRNGKTNARLQSKEGWYTWRSQLVDGLYDGLQRIKKDMEKDLAVVEKQAVSLAETVPSLIDHRASLLQHSGTLQQRLQDLDSIDHLALKASRCDLETIDTELQQKAALLAALQQDMQEKNETLSQATELKEEMQQQIAEADRVREEHRGWAPQDVMVLKSKADKIKEQTGWSLISAEEDPEDPNEHGVALTMSFQSSLRLFFYPSAYEPSDINARRRSARTSRSMSGPSAPISLTYSPHQADEVSTRLPTERRFFLQLIQSQLQTFSMMPKGSVSTKTILDTVSSSWKLADNISEEIRQLDLLGIIRVSIRGDERLGVKLMLMMPNRNRVDIEFVLNINVQDNGKISTSLSTNVAAVRGSGSDSVVLDASKTRKIQMALVKETETQEIGQGAWVGAVKGFEQWYQGQMLAHQKAPSKPRKTETTVTEEVAPDVSTTPKSSVPTMTTLSAVKRSPLAAKKSSIVQKKTIPVATSRQEKFRTSQREQLPAEKLSTSMMDSGKEKENVDPFGWTADAKPPAITPEMQEAMMQRTPIKRVGALRRSPI